jgi:V/A-type H+-transporting ATPase subunit K
MQTLVQGLLVVAIILSFVVPVAYFMNGQKTKMRYKKAMAFNASFFFGLVLVAFAVAFAGSGVTAYASEGAEAALSIGQGLGYIGAALAVGLSGIGGGIATGASAAAALGAVSEDASMLGKSFIYVGLSEGVCLYGLVISFMILGAL